MVLGGDVVVLGDRRELLDAGELVIASGVRGPGRVI
jgi:hypothetical protein